MDIPDSDSMPSRRGVDGGISHIMWMLTAYATVYISKIAYCVFSLFGRIPLYSAARAGYGQELSAYLRLWSVSVACGLAFYTQDIRHRL